MREGGREGGRERGREGEREGGERGEKWRRGELHSDVQCHCFPFLTVDSLNSLVTSWNSLSNSSLFLLESIRLK